MTVRLAADGAIDLLGSCSSEDAETLQRLLLDHPGATVNWGACEQLHAAVLQILMAAGPALSGMPDAAFLRTHIAPLLRPR